jgi:hypothetical protein
MKEVRLNRVEFLQALESVEPGLSARDALVQSSCYAFVGGRVLTFNNEVFARCPSGLPDDFQGAVHGKPLLEAVRKMPDDTIRLSSKGPEFCVEGKRDSAYVHVQPEVLLPYFDVEKPVKGMWKPVADELADGLAVAAECCGKDETNKFATTCVHFTPDYVEATDNFTVVRFTVKTGVKQECCVRAPAAKAVSLHGPTECQTTKNWVHYRNGTGVYVSARLYTEAYYDLTPFTKVHGEKTALPRDLTEAAERLEVFSKEYSDNNVITVELSTDHLRMEAIGVSGRQVHRAKLKYRGPSVAFTVGPQTLSKLVDRHAEVEIARMKHRGTDTARLIARSGPMFFFVYTGEPGKNGKEKTNA